MSGHSRNPHPIASATILIIVLLSLGSVAIAESPSAPVDGPPATDEVSPDATPSKLENAIALYASALPSEQARLREIVHRAEQLEIHEELLVGLLHRADLIDVDVNELVSILEHAVRVAERDLPSQPLFDRYLQGMAKAIPIGRIRMVAEEVEHRLDVASQTIDAVYGRTADPQQRRSRQVVIDHAAYAIGTGVPSEMIRKTLELVSTDETEVEEAGSPIVTLGLLVSGGMDIELSYEVVETGWSHGFHGDDLERLGRDLGTLGSPGEGPPIEMVHQILARIRGMEMRDQIFRDLDAMHGRIGEGHHPPGSHPGDDPTKMHGPGGPPENPGRQEDRGRRGGGSGR
jgi:hypothetical protein